MMQSCAIASYTSPGLPEEAFPLAIAQYTIALLIDQSRDCAKSEL